MCSGGSSGDASKQRELQEQQMAMQQAQFEEQMAAQRRQLAIQQAQYEEQFAMASATPPPGPNPVADVAAMATDINTSAMDRMGSGRRAMRSDLAISRQRAPKEARQAVVRGLTKYAGKPRRSQAAARADLLFKRMKNAASSTTTQPQKPAPQKPPRVPAQRQSSFNPGLSS